MADTPRNSSTTLEQRLELLESAVRALADEVDKLRGGADGVRSGQQGLLESLPGVQSPSQAKPPAPPQRSRMWTPPDIDFESLIGRYGTLVLATISALAAVGIFIGWAIEHGLLGPQQRIALGLVTAAALAAGGLRLRRRERSFGASLLGLALAVLHVCAWGMGPSLGLVPTWAAFLLAALASIVLAVFAHTENDEPLWSVGFSGAAVAPFVTATSEGSIALLGIYGAGVLCAAGYAMGGRPWRVAGRLFLLGALVYTTALSLGAERDAGPLLGMAFPLVVAVGGVWPWTRGLWRRDRLRALGVLAALGALRVAIGTSLPFSNAAVTAMVAAAGALWLVLVDRTHAPAESASESEHRPEGDWLDAGVLPIGFSSAAIMALEASTRGTGVGLALAAAVVFASMMRFPPGSLRDAAVFATLLLALIALVVLERGRPLMITGSVAALCLGAFAGDRMWRSGTWTTLGGLGMGWAAVASLAHLVDRQPYGYAPFMTAPSLVAAVVLSCAAASWWLSPVGTRMRRILGAGVLVWAFLWVHQEIAYAFNRTAATLLRVTYYAVTSVAAVWIGRSRQLATLRHVGLALAIAAAGTALYGARGLASVAARIGADLVAAVFLLAIAYWYRRPGAGDRPGVATHT